MHKLVPRYIVTSMFILLAVNVLIGQEITQPFLLVNLQQNYFKNKELEKSPQPNRKQVFDTEDNLGTEILKKLFRTIKAK